MSDLISRQAAIDAFEKELTVGESKGNYVTICSAVSYEGAKQIVERLPSAQPTIEPKRGKWEYIGGYGYQYRCSNCIMCAGNKTPYCPWCGARMEMRGENED